MTRSRPAKAPPQMNRMLRVSTCRNSCCGCLRPPCGGTEATVPSMSFSKACCTPSPETSRVMEVVRFPGNLVDLVDVDDAHLGLLHIVIALLQEFLDDVLDILAHVARFRQRGRIGDGERHVQQTCEGLGQQGLARAGWADHQNVALAELDIVLLVTLVEALVVVVYRYRQNLLGPLLPDHVLIEDGADLFGAGSLCPLLSACASCTSSRMMSLHRSTHSSQIKTEGRQSTCALRAGSCRRRSNTAACRCPRRCGYQSFDRSNG